MAGYDNTHRALLQVFFSRGTLTFEATKPILASILTASDPSREVMPNDITPTDFNTYIHTLNSAISPFDLEIRSSVPQVPASDHDDTSAPPSRVYALVNTTSDPITQLATVWSPDEIAFLKRVLDAMFEGNSRRHEAYAVTSMQALALSKPPAQSQQQQQQETTQGAGNAGLTKAEAERTLQGLVEEGWLELSRKGYYRLSSRALMELRNWLVETYNDTAAADGGSEDEEEQGVERVRFCHGCREIVIVGQRCADLDCPVRVHDFCARNMLRAAGGQNCPTCAKQWTGEALVGERAARGGRPSGAGQGRRSSAVVANGVGGEDDDDDE